MALNTDHSSVSAEHNSSRDMTLSSTSNPGLRATSAQATPSAKKLIFSLALLVLFTNSLLLFLTFASISGTWCQVNNNGNNGNSSSDNFKSMTVSELLNANLGAIAEVTCVLVAPDQCLPLVEVNLATLFAIDIQQQQQQQNLAVVDEYKKNNNSNSSSCQLMSIIQNLCVNRQNDQFKVVSVFLLKQKKSKQTT